MSDERDVRAVTEDYERWLRQHLDLDDAGLHDKHAAMRARELTFLRGTYYLWLVRVAEELPEVLGRTAVPVVGDLHVENFGTWRDQAQVRRWGVNDLDELASGAWLLDLLRLATSAVVAPHIRLERDEVCEELLTAYAGATAGEALDLADPAAGHLAALVPAFADRSGFYRLLGEGPASSVPRAVARAAAAVAEPGWRPAWHARLAGTGSLGHRRVVGVGPAADGEVHAREAKQLGPGTAAWAATHARQLAPGLPVVVADIYAEVLRDVHGPGGAARAHGWQIRGLAPDFVRIDLSGLDRHDGRRVLRSMARAVADVHGVRPGALVAGQGEARGLGTADFAAMVDTMQRRTAHDFTHWRTP